MSERESERREAEMVKNRVFGQVMEEGDKPAFFKILRRGDLSSEIMVSLLISHTSSLLFILAIFSFINDGIFWFLNMSCGLMNF